MNIKATIHILRNKLLLIGSKGDADFDSDIALMNQISFIGAVSYFLIALVGILFQFSQYYIIVNFISGLTILSSLGLNALGKPHISRYIIVGVIPVLLASSMFLFGSSFGEESSLTVILFLIYIFYENNRKKRIVCYTSIATVYIGPSLYLLFYTPIITKVVVPYDNVIAFIVCVVWLTMVGWVFQRRIQKQRKNQEALIDELKDKNIHLEKTKGELEQFTYIASHDLKSPLRTIISFLDLIKRDVNREEYDDLLSKLDFARSGAEQINYLVTDILEYSKLTNQKTPKRSMISLQSIVDKVRFNLAEIISRKSADLYIFDLPEFYCNETEMIVLFQNFIDNGVKYNEEATPNIFVKSNVEKDYLELQFIDNGIGIEEQYFEKIFQFFKRLHTSDQYKGTGLGLGLCKKIIDDMGGTIKVESMVNVGTTFTIRLPNQQVKETSSKSVQQIPKVASVVTN